MIKFTICEVDAGGVFEVEDDDVSYGEIEFRKEDNYVLKWFHVRKTPNGIITESADSDEPFDLEMVKIFIENIKNDANATYMRDGSPIFEVIDHVFKINVRTPQTGYNFNPDTYDFSFDLTNEFIKNDFVNTFIDIYKWMEETINNS
jgi:hypothetical protein